MRKRKVVLFLSIVAIVCVIGVFFSILLDMHRQRACLLHFHRFLSHQNGFLEKIDDEYYFTDNPKIIEDAMCEFLKEYPHFETYLNGNCNSNFVDLLPDKSKAFQVRNYLYFPYDSNGERIRRSTGKSLCDHILLVDSNPLWNGGILVLYSNRFRCELELRAVLDALENQYSPCDRPSVALSKNDVVSNDQTDEN